MESTSKKVRVSLVLREAEDKKSKLSLVDNDTPTSLSELEKVLNALGEEEVAPEKVLRIAHGIKASGEAEAAMLIDADLDELFDKKADEISAVDEIINFIKNL